MLHCRIISSIKKKKASRKASINQLRLLHNVIEKYAKPGAYLFDTETKIFYRIGSKRRYLEEKKWCYSFAAKGKKTFLQKLLDSIMLRKYLFFIKGNKLLFYGDLGIISISNKNIKFIDYNKKLLLTKYTDGASYILTTKNRLKLLNKAYPIVPFSQNNIENYTIETYLNKHRYNPEEGLISLFKQLCIAQSKDAEVHYISLSEDDIKKYVSFFSNLYDTALIKPFKEFINSNGYITVFSHGDLYYNNYINDEKGGYYLVDYEAAKYHIFFYDLFFYIIQHYLLFNDFSMLSHLRDGFFDEYLKKLFLQQHLSYKHKHLKLYLVLVLVEYVGFSKASYLYNKISY